MTPTIRSLVYSLLALGVTLSALPATAAEPQPNQLTPEQIAEGWISLFDGETLFGWTPTSDANWKVEEGAITVSEGAQGFLMTNSEFADYELHVEFKAPATTNSGVFLGTPLQPTDPKKDCYEINIAPQDNPYPTPWLVGRPAVEKNPANDADPWDGDWHSLDISLDAGRLTVAWDGQKVYKYADSSPLRRGRIALQFREGPVAFRSIRLKPLGLAPMLNGKDLTGWNDDRKKTSTFEITDQGELRVTNGSGQLESDASYGDFTMRFDCRVDGDGLNSGVFFRCIPREYMNGYECQINNRMKDGDPTQPTDFGTGAIYRRTPARRVNARDREWFTTTIAAAGPHIAVWVNGYQVTDWTDPRPPADNPRSGLRTAPGTIAIQGHDPTTDLRFRNLLIGELPKNADHDEHDEHDGGAARK